MQMLFTLGLSMFIGAIISLPSLACGLVVARVLKRKWP